MAFLGLAPCSLDATGIQPHYDITVDTVSVKKKNEEHYYKKNPQSGKQENEAKEAQKEERKIVYPNCDATVWLRSLEKEIIEPLEGTTHGKVPTWIQGSLIRNGPGNLRFGNSYFKHIFDGSAVLHKFRIRNGKVTYQNRYVKTQSYTTNKAANRIVIGEFGTSAVPDPCKTIFDRVSTFFSTRDVLSDNTNVTVIPYGDQIFCHQETPFIHRIDPKTLDTIQHVNISNYVSVLTQTAHAQADEDGCVYNLGQSISLMGPCYCIVKFPPPNTSQVDDMSAFQRAEIQCTVTARWKLNPCYMHSFFMTKNYWVFMEQPMSVSIVDTIKVTVRALPNWKSKHVWLFRDTLLRVVSRKTGKELTTRYYTDTLFFLHTINAYEDDGHLVLDACVYKNADMLDCMYTESLKNCAYDPNFADMFRGKPKRMVVPLNVNENEAVNLVKLKDTKCEAYKQKDGSIYCKPELLCNNGCEVPTINSATCAGRKYRYFYAISSDVDLDPYPGALIKVDTREKSCLVWSEDNVYPSEPIFIPHPDSKDADSGVLVSTLLRARGLDNQVSLLILDAKTMKELARVDFVAPTPVPKCLHGMFTKLGEDEDEE